MQETTTRHFLDAHRTVRFQKGLNRGTINETGDLVVRLRSFDIPVEVDDSCDIGLCGSDWVKEKELQLGIKLAILGEYNYGRSSGGNSPSLDLVVPNDNSLSSIQEVETGSMILTEYPNLTREHFTINGFETAELGQTVDAPTSPDDFRDWCRQNGKIGIRVVHGAIPELVYVGAGHGVMVNESGKTLRKNDLKVVDTIHEIKTLLIADVDALNDDHKREEIESLRRDLGEVNWAISGESETALRNFKERR